MKRLLAALLLAAAVPALALPSRYLYQTQALTQAAPSLSTDGMSLGDVLGFRVSVCAASGQTLTGGGTLRAWLYHTDAGLWMRNPSLDLTVSASGVRCQVFPDAQPVVLLSHRVYFASDTVTVSGGTTLDVRIDAQTIGGVQ